MYTIYRMIIGRDTYIGVTVNYKDRVQTHKDKLRSGIHVKRILSAYQNVKDISEVVFEVLQEDVPYTSHRRAERYYINILQPTLNLNYRVTPTQLEKVQKISRYDEVIQHLDNSCNQSLKALSKALKIDANSVSQIANVFYYKQDVNKLKSIISQASNNSNIFTQPNTAK